MNYFIDLYRLGGALIITVERKQITALEVVCFFHTFMNRTGILTESIFLLGCSNKYPVIQNRRLSAKMPQTNQFH